MKFETPFFLFMFLLSGLMSLQAADQKDCSGMNHPAFQDEYRACLRTNIAVSATAAGVDCVDCLYAQQATGTNSWVAGLSAIAQPLAYLAGQYTIASYQNKTQEAWAKAYSSSYTQCTNRFNSYLSYNTSVGANPIAAGDASTLMNSCNGNGYGSYAGYGGLTSDGVGGYGNPFQANGFSSGFMSGMGGPYAFGSNSLYGNGMVSGGVGVGAYGTTGSSAVYQTGVTAAFGF
ncbi:MAG: hypothetical protein H7336_01660 [Bacteriovorax sp.]|nr:hypothetical protein [Bacteriovorax sp.]